MDYYRPLFPTSVNYVLLFWEGSCILEVLFNCLLQSCQQLGVVGELRIMLHIRGQELRFWALTSHILLEDFSLFPSPTDHVVVGVKKCLSYSKFLSHIPFTRNFIGNFFIWEDFALAPRFYLAMPRYQFFYGLKVSDENRALSQGELWWW
jgi:hypothetical protein